MFIYIKKLKNKLTGLGVVILVIIAIAVPFTFDLNKNSIMLGSFMHVQRDNAFESSITEYDDDKNYELDERFYRPSKLPALKLKYNFIPKDTEAAPTYIAEGLPILYQSSEDLIHGYYAILKNAANMAEYYGGCGTILWMDIPYPYAYRLLSANMKENISLEEFKASFKGTGAMNLLQLTPAYQPPNTPDNIKYYFVEIEVLKGHKYKEGEASKVQPNYFEYYYGIITTEFDKKNLWKIKSVDYIPEIYLCHPFHGWDYDYEAFMSVVYNGWYNMSLVTDYVEVENNYIKVFASNKDNEYRFDFVRLTNGDDVLLHEYIKANDKWNEVSVLKPDVEKYYKISAMKFPKYYSD